MTKGRIFFEVFLDRVCLLVGTVVFFSKVALGDGATRWMERMGLMGVTSSWSGFAI